MKTQYWNAHAIRFAEHMPGEWWAAAPDVANALGYENADSMIRMLKPSQKGTHVLGTPGGEQEVAVISEQGLYKVILRAGTPEAAVFEDWVCDIVRALRKVSDSQGYEAFRTLDREHQNHAMHRLKSCLQNPTREDFIKANTIANKAVSNAYGHPTMLRKRQMTPDMLMRRQAVLDDTVNLMYVRDSFDVDISISEMVYRKYN